MVARAHIPVGTSFRHNRFLRGLAAVYGLFWIAAALSPLDRQTWLLENLLVFCLVGALVVSHGRFVFSNFSYFLIFAFLTLHAVGAHYTYSAVPLGDWLRDQLELERNHYDRGVHFAFGFLLAYPLREIALRRVHAHRMWSFALPVIATLALSSFYEIVEWGAARTVDPQIGMAYVGAQGDVWDGQKDMSLALAGSLAAMLLTALYRRSRGREPYLGF
jgi:putative membrane protein